MRASHYSFEPDLISVAIRIGDVSVGEAGSDLATTEQAPSRAFDLADGTVDVAGVHEPKAEMRDAPAETGGRGVFRVGDVLVPVQGLGVVHAAPTPLLAHPAQLPFAPALARPIHDR